jgi:hypothetical protein
MIMPRESAATKIATLLADPAASQWLKNALRTALERDAVDAANDAEVLYAVLDRRVSEVLGTTSTSSCDSLGGKIRNHAFAIKTALQLAAARVDDPEFHARVMPAAEAAFAELDALAVEHL